MLSRFPSDDSFFEHDLASHSSFSGRRPANQRQERELDRLAGCASAKKIDLPLAQVTRLLIDASQSNRAWLKDFSDDVVRIDSDLYDVLLAYQAIRQASS